MKFTFVSLITANEPRVSLVETLMHFISSMNETVNSIIIWREGLETLKFGIFKLSDGPFNNEIQSNLSCWFRNLTLIVSADVKIEKRDAKDGINNL